MALAPVGRRKEQDMGVIKDQLRADLTAAMKARDEFAKSTIRMALGAIQYAEVAGEQARVLSESEEIAVLTKEQRTRTESAETYAAAGRPELAAKEVAEKIMKEIDFKGELRWDISKPDGTPRKLTDVTKLHNLGWHHKIEIDEGIHRLYEWYKLGICINHKS